MQTSLPDGARFMRAPEVIDRCGIKRSTLWEAVKRGTFPAPVRIGPNATAWISTEVESWMRDRIRESREAA